MGFGLQPVGVSSRAHCVSDLIEGVCVEDAVDVSVLRSESGGLCEKS